MKCARTACQAELDGEYIAIWNNPSTGDPRMYCVYCGMKIIRDNKWDALKLKHERRSTEPSVSEAATPNELRDAVAEARKHRNLGNVSIEARNLIVRAYLDVVKPDDEEAVTEEWLLYIGVQRGSSPQARKLYLDSLNFDDVGKGTVSVCDYTENAVLGKAFKTRGDVRRLCSALGIELKEPT